MVQAKALLRSIAGWTLLVGSIITLAGIAGAFTAVPFDPATYCDDFWVLTVEDQVWVRAYKPGCKEGWSLYPDENIHGNVFFAAWAFFTILGAWWVIKRNLAARA